MDAVNLEDFGRKTGKFFVMAFAFWMGYLIVSKVFKKKGIEDTKK